MRVFVFEDNETLRSMMTSLLESRGYQVMAFSEPGLCPVYADRDCECPYDDACADAIISDVNMPNVTGLEFLENRIRHGCRVRCRALMSGGWTETEVKEAKRLGCQIFEKPFRLEDLVRWLEACRRELGAEGRLVDLTRLKSRTEAKRG